VKDMERCICTGTGYCELHRAHIDRNFDFLACKRAHPQEREGIHKKYQIKRKREEVRKVYLQMEGRDRFVTFNNLIEDCRDLLLPQIVNLNLKGVLGIPRSGVLPASVIALWLNLPIYTMNKLSYDLEPMSAFSDFGGYRMKDYGNPEGKILVIDDTTFSGKAIELVRSKIKEDAFYATVYTHPASVDKVDFFAKILPPPHALEWNLFNSTYVERTLLDFDGILCPNVPHEKCINEKDYIDYIKNVEPFYHRMPKSTCCGIVTARLEKYRDITEGWLKKYGIEYLSLIMYPTEREDVRNKNHIQEAANFKAKHFVESDADFFIESERAEAIIIRRESGKLVFCPEESL
tara:strand:+ start:14552 stop:15595 length:1044 start_codon:yes stop_codon:yes gene_type:complete